MSAVPLTAELLREWPLPALGPDADKDARGKVLLVAGGAGCPGAALLAGEAVLRSGAGKVQVATSARAALPLAIALPEGRVIALAETDTGEIAGRATEPLIRLASRADCIAIGPGMLEEAAAEALTRRLLTDAPDAAVLLDAAALPSLPALAEGFADRRAAMTPHAGEMAKLMGLERAEVEREPERTARSAADRFGVAVALKGATTFIVEPGGRCWVYRDSPDGLGTAGSGDVLAGLSAGLLARGAEPVQALLFGVWAHAQAGRAVERRIGPLGYLARELLPTLPAALASVTGESGGGEERGGAAGQD